MNLTIDELLRGMDNEEMHHPARVQFVRHSTQKKKSKRKKKPAPHIILALGWDTESTSDTRMRAMRGPAFTPWRSSWAKVKRDVEKSETIGLGRKINAIVRRKILARLCLTARLRNTPEVRP